MSEASARVLHPVLALHIRKDVGKLERAQKRATKLTRDLGNMTWEEKLEDLGLFI